MSKEIYKPDYVLKKYYEAFPVGSNTTKWGYAIDWTVDADKHRFFLIDNTKQEIVYSWFTSHGRNSGDLSRATKFSNINNSYQSVVGRIRTGNTYISSRFGYALRLDGLDKGVNDNVRKRAIVMHKSLYVSDDYMKWNKYPGRSLGCPTLCPDDYIDIIDKLKGGSFGLHIDKRD